MFDEMEIVVKYGGIIEDVIVEHPIYGEIRGVLRIKNLNDLNKFKKSIEEIEVRPLSLLTDGIHLHTISADSNENMQLIKDELKEKVEELTDERDSYKNRVSELEEQLKNTSYIRVSKSIILNIEKLQSVKPLINGKLEANLKNNEKILINRHYVPEFKKKFGI